MGLQPDIKWSFFEGTAFNAHDMLGAHPKDDGVFFAVWAPNANQVNVVGDWNGWNSEAHPLENMDSSGVWAGFIQGAKIGQAYKFAIRNREGHVITKADPYAQRQEVPPKTASVITKSDYQWGDSQWMSTRKKYNDRNAPIAIYELHLGSWRRPNGELPSYRSIAQDLVNHIKACGFTHVEFLPLTGHPFYGSWGYQCLGYFASSEYYGSPDDLRYLIDVLHQNEIGVILDWVPAHFPTDDHGLARFDGSALYEHDDPRKGFHPDWNTAIFNYGRNEVRSFLLSSAYYWFKSFHIDGIRVDAVASMLYLDYSRNEGEWIPNEFGGNENLEAVQFLKDLNTMLYREFPDIMTVAEESTAWGGVSRPIYDGGLGFGFKWDMGWMHDTLQYLEREPIHRQFHHGELTFRGIYAFSENYVLALSHDEVVHGKQALISKMPGDEWQQRATIRALFGLQIGQPGKKLLFMGMEFGQWTEWNHEAELDWALLEHPNHIGLQQCLYDLNMLYRTEAALNQKDLVPEGVSWTMMDDHKNSALAFVRHSDDEDILVVANLTPIPRENYQIGVPKSGKWVEILNTDAEKYGGAGRTCTDPSFTVPEPCHGQAQSILIGLAPLSVAFWKRIEE